MRFREAVKQMRLRKKRQNPQAYTQSNCGSRMTDRNGVLTPIGQVGWSRYENEDYVPEYGKVVGIANALNATPDERRQLFDAAGYKLDIAEEIREEPTHIPELDFAQGIELNLTTGEKHYLTPEEIKKLFARLEKGMEILRDSMLRYAENNNDSIEK